MMDAFEALHRTAPRLAVVLDRFGLLEDNMPPARRRQESHLEALAHIVVGQQLSTQVARVIWSRVREHFERDVTAAKLAATSVEALRSLGLSGAKARYLHHLAEHETNGLLETERFDELSDAEVTREITAIKGFGPWSADMFLMFHLGRPDVMPVGDLGIREAVKRIYELPERPVAVQLLAIAERWRPHRTLACRYLWKSLDNDPLQPPRTATETEPVSPRL